MLDKKTDILLAARKLFSEKDFKSVSMQAIAEECKMSKASIYKLFQSKEDLLLELLSFNQKQMVAAASRLQENTALTPEERLTQKVKMELEGFRRNQQFFNMLTYGNPKLHNNRVKQHIHQTRSTIICWHRDSLIQAYGESILPFVWDLVIILHGMMREFLMLIKIEEKPLELDPIAEFIISTLNQIVKNKETRQSLLPPEAIELYIHSASSYKPKDKSALLSESLKELHNGISSLPAADFDVDELTSAAAMLEEEAKKEEPRAFLLKSLIGYLEQTGVLTQPVSMLKTLLIT
ncbi:Bacterial regulatory proteins, tetR family [Bacillus subtilis]|uniref:TetR/AcrR family transcriptional regulator n=1 Tax=Bacillus spizizenii TaxID=96241 RepID=UPI0006A8490B|nr:TetR/AcrR family transcriptional regulator [Bacillus spizizenii]CUB22702.1 Bacterial regulatory proteins, tetR family [Bacillus cereus]CUB34118.1 Bacterial regulatory proteins, tetR family [Bacillus subtilis]MCI4169655.1 TetR/AcrR family transcriptional regulator [Bacillus spizizenii]MED0869932.1 helix-turn-helix domain containing protein [Bacillus spizizenii]MED1071853.1 helix-turn-helix domain containing protein [Bacillus spizizenii]